jgi:hypothetical protein
MKFITMRNFRGKLIQVRLKAITAVTSMQLKSIETGRDKMTLTGISTIINKARKKFK